MKPPLSQIATAACETIRSARLFTGVLVCVLAALPASTFGQVTNQRLVKAAQEPGAWLMYTGTYDGQRFSRITALNRQNVGALAVRWVYQMQAPGLVETTPLVADGVMYITEPPSTVSALDLRTGRRLWTYSKPLPQIVLTLGFPPVNRGVAIRSNPGIGDTVFVGTIDAWLVALDAKSGAERWRTKVADNATGHSITAAPLIVKDMVIVGISGGEAGIRGFLDAYDAVSGERRWRWYSIPGPGEPGHETWSGDSWKTGAGPTWVTGTYDPELDLLYWGIGNPGPDWNGDVRPGDNLYTSSVVALDANNGTLRWYFQFTPHDTHDWDANQVPVLIDAPAQSAGATSSGKLLAAANRNAFFYLLERETGRFLRATPYAKQTWAERIDENGRPLVIPGTEPTEEGVLVYPSLQGATNWYSPSYSPQAGLFYVATREMGAIYYKAEAEYEEGREFLGGGEQALTGEQAWGAIRALDATTGERQWEFRLKSPPWSGVLSTAGELVFGGSNEGDFFALDARNGKPLWNFQTGGAIRNDPIAFEIDGKPHVAIAGGGALFVFALPE